jgi:hypothetical protein
MYITEQQFDTTVEKAFKRGMEFQKKNQKDLELKWYELGYNSALRDHNIDFKATQQEYGEL